jgi:chitinase
MSWKTAWLRAYPAMFILIILSLLDIVLGADCSATTPCATGCCSKFGFCGFGIDFCGAGCLNNCDAKLGCDAGNPCEIGCCSKYGFCGFGKDYCSPTNCVAGCDRKADCDPGGWGAAYVNHTTCPLNVCCSKYGFCGLTEEFCGDRKVNRPSCDASGQQINRVIGYYESWSNERACGTMYPESVPGGVYTHLNYAFASIDPVTFEVVPAAGQDEAGFTRIQGLKIADPNLKIWLAIGGWTFSDAGQPTATTFSDLAAASEPVQAMFFRSLQNLIVNYGFDGVDIDW